MFRKILLLLLYGEFYAFAAETHELNNSSATEDTISDDVPRVLRKKNDYHHLLNFTYLELENEEPYPWQINETLLTTNFDINISNNCKQMVRKRLYLQTNELYFESDTLVKLFAANCHISRPILKALPNLEVLDLSHNRIEVIWQGCFDNNPNLKILDLSFNAIEYIELFSFTPNVKLQDLNLAMNKLIGITKFAYNALPNVESLNVSHNFIETMKDELPKAKILDFSFNEITSIPEEIDQFFPSLEVLNLSENPLLIFHRIRSESLTDLSISKCKLRTIQDEAFVETSKLKFLDVSSNNLKRLDFLKFVDYSATVNLSLNRWVCTCDVTIPLQNDLICEPRKISLAEFCDESSDFEKSVRNGAWMATSVIYIIIFIAPPAFMIIIYLVRRHNKNHDTYETGSIEAFEIV